MLGNPPYIRRHYQEDLTRVRDVSSARGASRLMDSYCYFLLRACEALRVGGRLAVIVNKHISGTRPIMHLLHYGSLRCSLLYSEPDGRMCMDMPDLEAEVQRLIGYDCLVTGGVTEKGPYLSFNARRRLLRMWIPRTGVDAKRIAELARGYLSGADEPAYKEITYEPA